MLGDGSVAPKEAPGDPEEPKRTSKLCHTVHTSIRYEF